MRRLRAPPARRPARESTIALINVVFLLLVFFIVAGTLSAPRDTSVDPARAEGFEAARIDPHMIYIDAEGTLRVAGRPVDTAEAIETVSRGGRASLTVVPDRRLEASRLIAILAELRALTDRPIGILTERARAEAG